MMLKTIMTQQDPINYLNNELESWTEIFSEKDHLSSDDFSLLIEDWCATIENLDFALAPEDKKMVIILLTELSATLTQRL